MVSFVWEDVLLREVRLRQQFVHDARGHAGGGVR